MVEVCGSTGVDILVLLQIQAINEVLSVFNALRSIGDGLLVRFHRLVWRNAPLSRGKASALMVVLLGLIGALGFRV